MLEDKPPSLNLETIKSYANEQEKKNGFILCFRGEVDEQVEDDYQNKSLAGTWYSESIFVAARFLVERENILQVKGHIYSVIVPRSILESRDPMDAASNFVHIGDKVTRLKKELVS